MKCIVKLLAVAAVVLMLAGCRNQENETLKFVKTCQLNGFNEHQCLFLLDMQNDNEDGQAMAIGMSAGAMGMAAGR